MLRHTAWGLGAPSDIAGPYIRYLGWHLGNMAPYDQYSAALQQFKTKTRQLGTLPLSGIEKVKALITWAYPVFDVVAKLVYPVQQVRTRMDEIARQSLQMANWSMTDSINVQLESKGGIGTILPSHYLLYVHSKRYAGWMRHPDSLTGVQLRSFHDWKGE